MNRPVNRQNVNRSAAHSKLKHDIREQLGQDLRLRIFDNPRGFDERARVKYGLAPGASDLIAIARTDPTLALQALARLEQLVPAGWSHDVAVVRAYLRARGVFVGLEVKTGGATPEEQQQRFLGMINAFGGVGRVVRSTQEATAAVDEATK